MSSLLILMSRACDWVRFSCVHTSPRCPFRVYRRRRLRRCGQGSHRSGCVGHNRKLGIRRSPSAVRCIAGLLYPTIQRQLLEPTKRFETPCMPSYGPKRNARAIVRRMRIPHDRYVSLLLPEGTLAIGYQPPCPCNLLHHQDHPAQPALWGRRQLLSRSTNM